MISSSVAIDFNASEVHTTSEIIFEQTTDIVYAPVHPTSEEVEAAAATDIVTFNDANLEQALAHDLGVAVGDITVGDMETLTHLYLDYNSISDITGLEYATNLTYLDLGNNSISDITPLSGLTNLTYLNLSSNSISDITPLSGLTNLTALYLGLNSISDITPLSGLTNLTY
ncbi:leucine-rich repeat domain-containing protein (plasmid) [Mollicutes bacterium LVI A0078]|nr:leucine-rich repeat domain-containing protein [Mollicutes bacterium LVI A0078]